MLWLCLHLPHLSVEVFTRGAAAPGPLVVVAGRGRRRSVVAVNLGAAAAGIRPGMALGAACGLVPELVVRERDEGAEAGALAALAGWAGQFTPLVSLVCAGVLLEVEGSLGLFGGAGGLSERVEEGAASLGYRACLALAPNPLAAELLARAGQGDRVTEPACLEAALASLGLGLLEVPEKVREALRALGVCTLGDCLRLPRAGLARRFGRELPEILDRALGRVPDPRSPFVPPPRFASRLELPAEVAGAETLLFAAHRLLRELEGFLAARGSGVDRFCLSLVHRDARPTRVEVGLASPGRDPKRLLGLLGERLARTPLPAPVRALGLEATGFSSMTPRSRDLFGGEEEGRPGEGRLLERLRARLGDEAVQGLRLVADYRPERAFQWVSGGEAGPAPADILPGPAGLRPLWLLPAPVVFRCPPAGVPAGLILLAGPERIETGWWDSADAARDYFVAEDAQGSRLWVFRERQGAHRWFAQGIFG
ncbi:MAG: DNA polymerase Y family protein [Deltaproteobacteria bacterium]|nr:DNA polymerase Y family protein [Deltaproteobacteria bacterium]